MKHPIGISLIVLILLSACGLAIAHSGATGVVKERMELMKSIANQMKTVGLMIKGETGYDAGQVERAARTITAHAEKVPDMFPEGTFDAPSEALPAIRQDWPEFLKMTDDLRAQAGNLLAAAQNSAEVEGIRPAFAAVGKTCAACHEDFRLKN